MISHPTTSNPGTCLGRSASVAGSCASSLKQGIWMMSLRDGMGDTGRRVYTESATRPRAGTGTGWAPRLRAVPAAGWAPAGLVLLTVAALVAFLVYPTFP